MLPPLVYSVLTITNGTSLTTDDDLDDENGVSNKHRRIKIGRVPSAKTPATVAAVTLAPWAANKIASSQPRSQGKYNDYRC